MRGIIKSKTKVSYAGIAALDCKFIPTTLNVPIDPFCDIAAILLSCCIFGTSAIRAISFPSEVVY